MIVQLLGRFYADVSFRSTRQLSTGSKYWLINDNIISLLQLPHHEFTVVLLIPLRLANGLLLEISQHLIFDNQFRLLAQLGPVRTLNDIIHKLLAIVAILMIMLEIGHVHLLINLFFIPAVIVMSLGFMLLLEPHAQVEEADGLLVDCGLLLHLAHDVVVDFGCEFFLFVYVEGVVVVESRA